MTTAMDGIKKIIDDNQQNGDLFKNFVLQGGAGSGKTESLKEIITYISEKYPNKKIACITHTNVAVDEIILRIGNKYEISTIHSFLNSIIKNYKKNLKEIIHHIFSVSKIENMNYDEYKKVYGKYSTKLYIIKSAAPNKIMTKKEYDKNATSHNDDLNRNIDSLNKTIKDIISEKEHINIEYNETRFDSFEELTFSHDSLLFLAYKLCKEFDLLPKIINDKYDFIFIDEYQDTDEYVIKLFLELLPQNEKTTIGLFGDSMQSIYENGVGSVTEYINKKMLTEILKEDNYRCSSEVIKFINVLRNDTIEQKVALKKGEDESSRKGSVKFYYKISNKKPNKYSSIGDKSAYQTTLNNLINLVKEENKSLNNRKILMLTNKSISTETGFMNLYTIFSDRYSDVKDEIEREFSRIQLSDIVELCRLYQNKNYNQILVLLKKNGFQVKSIEDKKKISTFLNYLLKENLGIDKVLHYAFKHKLIKKTEAHESYRLTRKQFLDDLESDSSFKNLETFYLNGANTINRIKDNHNIDLSKEEFDALEKALKKKKFYIDLFSDKVKFNEILNYYKYLNEELEYITMHKTKGSGIENVIVVLDEFFWDNYNFKGIYNDKNNLKSLKLFYVACSRAIKNLIIIRLVEDEDEEKIMKGYFKNCEMIKK